MSSWYVGQESLSMLTDMISRYLVVGYNAFGFEFPSEIQTIFCGKSDKEIFNELAQMNKDALNARYSDAEDMYDDLPYEEGHDIWKAREDGIQSWHYQFLKSLQCYNYQCSEGDVPDTPIYKAMEKLEHVLTKFIACNQEEYEEAEWR